MEQFLVAKDEELLPGSGDGDIEFSIHDARRRLSEIGENIEFVTLGDGGAIDDDVALGALVALHRVDDEGLGN